MGHLDCFVFVQLMLRYQSCQVGAVHAASDVVPRGNGEEGSGVVVESDGVVEAGGLGGQLAEAHHAFGAVVKPPGRSQAKAGVMPCQRRQLAAVGGFIQGKEDDGERGVVAEALQQRLQRVHVFGRHGNVGADVAAKAGKYLAIVIAAAAGMDLHHQTVLEAHARHFGQHLGAEELLLSGRRPCPRSPGRRARRLRSARGRPSWRSDGRGRWRCNQVS